MNNLVDKNKCILPFTRDVEMVAYQNKAFPLGIIKANLQEYDIWLCNKLVNTILKLNGEFNSYDKDLWSIEEGVTSEQYLVLHPETFTYSGLDLIQFNKEMLSEGFYIIGQYNEFYIEGKAAYKKYNFNHDYVIFGYDDKEKVFKSAGYLISGNYDFFDIPYQAYYNSVVSNPTKLIPINYYKISKSYISKIDIDFIKEELKNYLYSRLDNKGTKTRVDLGIVVWEKLIEYVLTVGEKQLDYRYSRHYMEHRGIMTKRFKILYDKGYVKNLELICDYERNVYLTTRVIHLLFIKYNLTKSPKVYEKILSLMKKSNEEEVRIISQIISCLDN